MAPIAHERFTLRFTFSKSAYEQLSHAQDLLSHQIPSRDLSQVLEQLIQLGVQQLEKRKFASTDRPPRAPIRASHDPRYIPRHVKRAVWKRDSGQCTFVSADGHRCASRHQLEFDHIHPVARGGQATVEGIRLRCRAHNQYAAECAFGADFMKRKREEAEAAKLARQAVEEVLPYLRALRISATDAKRAAQKCAVIPDASIEERVRLALSSFGPRRHVTAHA